MLFLKSRIENFVCLIASISHNHIGSYLSEPPTTPRTLFNLLVQRTIAYCGLEDGAREFTKNGNWSEVEPLPLSVVDPFVFRGKLGGLIKRVSLAPFCDKKFSPHDEH